MWRGDVERFYRALRQDHPAPPSGQIPCLDEVRAIAKYYAGLSPEERLLLLAWAKKEESGIGVIPLTLSSVPFVGLLLGNRLVEPLARTPVWVVFGLWVLSSLVVVLGFWIHQRQMAYTKLHIVLLEQANKRAESTRPQPEHAVKAEPRPPKETTLPTTPNMH